MKRLKYVLTVAGMFLLAGCFEINEDIEVNANGKGVYESDPGGHVGLPG